MLKQKISEVLIMLYKGGLALLLLAVFLFRTRSVHGFVSLPPINQCHRPEVSPFALMGIKGFRAWFETTFPNAMMAPISPSKGDNDEFDHVLVDLNQVLVSKGKMIMDSCLYLLVHPKWYFL